MPAADDEALKAAVAEAVNGRGLRVEAGDVALETLDGDAVPDWRIFRGWYTYFDMREAVSGVADGDGRVTTVPLEGAQQLFEHWAATGPPGPALQARVLGFLLGGSGRHEIALDQETADRFGESNGCPGTPRAPVSTGDGGVVFWWVGRGGLRQVTVRPDEGLAEVTDAGPDEVS